jgi:Flp pilus assembly pilin Flp
MNELAMILGYITLAIIAAVALGGGSIKVKIGKEKDDVKGD